MKIRYFAAILLLILININFINNAFAATTVIDSTGSGTCKNGPYTSGNYAQKFVAGTNGTITGINILIGSGSTSYFNNSNIKIYADSSATPSATNIPGTLLTTFSPSSISAGYANYTGSVTLASGVHFWIFPSYSSGNTSWCYAYPSNDGLAVTYNSGWTNANAGSNSTMFYNLGSGNGTSWGSSSTSTFLIQMQVVIGSIADTTAPTFTSSSSFSVAENISTSSNAATIKVSESATVTISSGADAARFNIVTSDSVTAFIRFKVSPDFEAPTDVGGNNVYEITLTATDAASNAGTQSITITVTDVVDTSSFNSLTLSGAATYRQVVTITANVSVTSRVTFRAKNIIISGCKNKITSGSSPNITATCSWKPSTRGAVVITATAVPTGAGISGATATPVSVVVGNRSGARS